MTAAHAALLAGAGLLAGFVNGIVGTGSLVSFPALVAAGYPALVANVTNTLAIIPGYVGNTIGYRRELTGQARRIVAFGAAVALGSAGGCAALLVAPPSVFRSVVPYLILLAATAMAGQKRVAAAVSRWRSARSVLDADGSGAPDGAASPAVATAPATGPPQAPAAPREHTLPLMVGMFLAGVYAGYFGAGVSVVLLAVLGAFIPDTLQRLNALRSILTFAANLLAGVIFAVVASVAWSAAAVMAPASLAGGWLGSTLARRIPDDVLRWGVVIFAVGVGIALLVAG